MSRYPGLSVPQRDRHAIPLGWIWRAAVQLDPASVSLNLTHDGITFERGKDFLTADRAYVSGLSYKSDCGLCGTFEGAAQSRPDTKRPGGFRATNGGIVGISCVAMLVGMWIYTHWSPGSIGSAEGTEWVWSGGHVTTAPRVHATLWIMGRLHRIARIPNTDLRSTDSIRSSA